jgi:putative IMPACT (imprinted ancient) family translation regulator
MVLNELKQHKKIANAKHNVYAYRYEIRQGIFKESIRLNFRIISENGMIINECNDDGENRAGEWILEPLMV